MITPEKDITSLTRHPQWRNFVILLLGTEKAQVAALRTALDPVANQHLIFLSSFKAALRMRSENKDLFNV